MQYDQAAELWRQLLASLAGAGDSSHTTLHNPAIRFTQDAHAGKFDNISDAEYQDLLKRIEESSALFRDKPSAPADDILLRAIRATRLERDELMALTDILATASERVDYVREWKDGHDSITPALGMSPQDIYKIISAGVSGQEEAKKAAALVVYNHLHGRKRNAVFAGPTGSGKSEIWRVLAKQFPFIKIFDATTISADGWKGGLHFRSILESVPEGERGHMLIVLDEADKMLEPSVGSGGTDFSIKVQDNLLKILDGDTLTFEGDEKQPGFTCDCTGVSVVMLGAFERLYKRKNRPRPRGIGFNSQIQSQTDTGCTTDNLTMDDLIAHGNMRREIAGRLHSITLLHEMTAEDYKSLLVSPVSPVSKLADQYGIQLTISDDLQSRLAQQAAESRLGVRYIRSSLESMIDHQLFTNPDASSLHLTHEEPSATS